MNKYLAVAAAVLVVAVAAVCFFSLSGRIDDLATAIQNLPSSFGAASGAVHSNPEQFLDQIVVSRYGLLNGFLPNVTTTTIPQSATGTTAGQLSWKTICQNSVVDANIALSATQTLTLPSSSYMMNVGTSTGGGCLTKVGDYRDLLVWNNSTGSITLVISDQSSTIKTLTSATSSASMGNGTSTLLSKDFAKVTAVRITSSTYSATGTLLTTSVWLNWLISVYR